MYKTIIMRKLIRISAKVTFNRMKTIMTSKYILWDNLHSIKNDNNLINLINLFFQIMKFQEVGPIIFTLKILFKIRRVVGKNSLINHKIIRVYRKEMYVISSTVKTIVFL